MSWLSDLFNPKKHKAADLPEVTKYIRPQDTEAGGYSLPILKDRASGKGVAFPKKELTFLGQPYAQAATGQWERHGRPAMEDQLSARGMGGTSFASQILQGGELDLADKLGVKWADLNKWNEELKQSGIETGLGGLQKYMGSELDQSNKTTSAQNERNMGNWAVAEQNRKMPFENMQKIGTGAMNAAVTLAGLATGNPMAVAGGVSGLANQGRSISSSGNNTIRDILSKRLFQQKYGGQPLY